MINILFLTCGTNGCFHMIRKIKQEFKNDFRIIGTDINKQWEIPSGLFLDVFYQSPYSQNSDYYNFILDICKNEKVDYLIPSFDIDQKLFYPENQELLSGGTQSLGTSIETLKFYGNKILTSEYLKNIGIPVPNFFSLSEIEDEKRYFVKPFDGCGSINAQVMSGKEIKSLLDFRKYIVQEICSEPEFTQECFFYKNKLYSITRKRIAAKSGVCTKTKIYRNEKLHELANRFALNTSVPFYFNMQFMKNACNDFVCTDLNLRNAGGMGLSCKAGWDVTTALAKILLGKDEKDIVSTVNANIIPQYVMRAYEDIVTKTCNRKIAFDLDGTLLDSRKRHSIVMSFVLKDFGLNINTDDLVLFKAEKRNNLEWLISKGIQEDLAKQIQQKWIENIEQDVFLSDDILYPDSIDILKKLSVNNDLYLITARNNVKKTYEQLKALKINQYFEEIKIVTSDKRSTNAKSDFLIENKIEILVGDTEVDYEAAKLAKIDFYYRFGGFRSMKFLSNLNVKEFDLNFFV